MGTSAGSSPVSELSVNKDPIRKANKLDDVCYDIRGPVLEEAKRLEDDGQQIIKLNIGNPAPWGLLAPDEIITDVIHNLPSSQGYCESKGLYSARKAIMQYCQEIRIPDVGIDDIFIGNGVSELAQMAIQGLINPGDEVLIPAPDFPLWSAVVNLAGGKPVHYLCDEKADWFPDINDIKNKLTNRTKAIVVINPNNPTGAVYSKELLKEIVEIARTRDLVIFADEIYDKILYDEAKYVPVGSLVDEVLVVTLSGLSKSYRIAGFRVGWMVLSGAKARASDYISGLDILASMRLCANVPSQHAIQTALGGFQSIETLTAPEGSLSNQRLHAHNLLNQIDGVSCTLPRGALYLFPKLDTKKFNIKNDEQFVLDLLKKEHVLVVQGTGFNWPEVDHFRIVFLPKVDELTKAITAIERFLSQYRQ